MMNFQIKQLTNSKGVTYYELYFNGEAMGLFANEQEAQGMIKMVNSRGELLCNINQGIKH